MSKRKLDREVDDLREENEMHDLMLSSLVDVLERKVSSGTMNGRKG